MGETLAQMQNMALQWLAWLVGSLFCLFFFGAIGLNILEWVAEKWPREEKPNRKEQP